MSERSPKATSLFMQGPTRLRAAENRRGRCREKQNQRDRVESELRAARRRATRRESVFLDRTPSSSLLQAAKMPQGTKKAGKWITSLARVSANKDVRDRSARPVPRSSYLFAMANFCTHSSFFPTNFAASFTSLLSTHANNFPLGSW